MDRLSLENIPLSESRWRPQDKPVSQGGTTGLIGLLKGLVRLLKGLIRPFKGLIRSFKGLRRPLKGLIRPKRLKNALKSP